jgi:hypothetical protein
MNQMPCMGLGLLTAKGSIRDLMRSYETHKSKYHHIGFGSTVSLRNLVRQTIKKTSSFLKSLLCVDYRSTQELEQE